MKKKVFGRKLSRDRGSRNALYRSLIRALVLHGEIIITFAKAKAINSEVEKLVTLAKKNGVSERRQLTARLANDRKTVDALFTKVAKAFSGKESGFTRIVKLPERRGDRSPVVRLEWSQKIVTSDRKKLISKIEKTEEKKSSAKSILEKAKSRIRRNKTENKK